MNQILTIPREIAQRGDLVVMPREEYEKLLRLSKKPIKKFDFDLNKSLEEVKQGKIIGPFDDARSLMRSLRASRPKDR